jgi:hypothetical protein
MSTQMGDFLIKLSQDPFLVDRFNEDPSGVISDYNLTPEEASLVLKRDSRAMDDSFRVLALCSGNAPSGVPKKKTAKKTAKKKKK